MHIAYLDPGSGSIIASALVGGVAGLGVAARSVRARLGGALRKKSSGDVTEATESGDATEAVESAEDATVETDA
jgi:hypothetical protein